MTGVIKPTPAEAADIAREKARKHGLSPERAEKRAKEASDTAFIGLIADRICGADTGARTSTVILMMQVKAANQDLNLEVLYGFDDANFLHDMMGIARHATPGTGVLKDHFLPRSMGLEKI